MDRLKNSSRTTLMCILLAGVTLAVFWPTHNNDFVNFDDPNYVLENPLVRGGLVWENVRLAFTHGYYANWHPLTLLSHMLDVQWFGLQPGWHHLASLGWHMANTVLLFLLLRQMTELPWRSASVAALFALHPLHVESVAWISERKDVLSTFFALLTLLLYARFVSLGQLADPVSPSLRARRTLNYCMALLCFLLALMSKAMVVTLPCLMLLLDYWPLRRLDPAALNRGPAALRRIGPLLVEKLPFFALAAGFTVIASLMLKQANAIEIGKPVSLGYRSGNAIVACAYYVQKLFWPSDLAVFYPRPATWPTGALALGSLLVLGMTAISAAWFRRRPYFVVGWLWFAGALAPVSGLVQLGEHAFADRYTYLPLVGLFIILVWGVAEVASSMRLPYRALVAASVLILICLGLATRQQLRYWRNSRALLEHALVVGGDSTTMHNNLGSAVAADGDWAGAEAHFRTGLRLRPDLELTRLNLALALARQHKSDAALQELARLGPALLPQAHEELGRAFAETGQTAEARAQFQELIKLKPDAESHYHLALSLLILGEAGEAARHYREALRLKPDWQEPLNDLAWLLATQPNAGLRDGPAAVVLAERACVLSGHKEARFLGTLDAAYAEAGRFPEAIATAEDARRVALAAGQKDVAELAVKRLDLYRAGKPFRQAEAP